ncbi:MAG: PorT family protein [Bacteroidales bacterium]|nr:PorT family protein [Bacteroidales bacterium]MBR4686732.1 PorT family protein [Bacteroidales bacterium]
MKRIITLVAVAAASLLMAARAHAQFGIVGGITSSTTEMTTAEDVKSMSLYHAGLTYKFNLGAGFAIQPSVLYQVKGANLGELNTASSEDFKVKSGYVELPVGLQWGPDLMVFRPFVMAEPFIGYQVTSSDRGADSIEGWTEQAKNKFEYGFALGGGLELAGNIQLSVQWFNNMGSLVNSSSSDFSDKVKNFKGIKFSVAILFF